jgi:hypothetical protein
MCVCVCVCSNKFVPARAYNTHAHTHTHTYTHTHIHTHTHTHTQLSLGDMHPGASQPFPNWATSGYTWPALLKRQSESAFFGEGVVGTVDSLPPRLAPPQPVPSVWEDVDVVRNKREKRQLSGLKTLPPYEECFQGLCTHRRPRHTHAQTHT